MNEKNWKKIKLSSDATEYLKESLAKGHTLSKYLLQRADLNRGEVFTFVPNTLNESAANNFRAGPLLPETPVEIVLEAADADLKSRIVRTPNTDSVLAEVIITHMANDADRMAVFEEGLAKPSDPCMRSAKLTPWQPFGDEVYYFLARRGSSYFEVLRAIKNAHSAYPGLIGILTRASRLQKSAVQRGKLTAKMLKDFAARAEFVLVSAYDGEGYLIWNAPGARQEIQG
jgi:hypothetical protein